jgi:hypothetical protein
MCPDICTTPWDHVCVDYGMYHNILWGMQDITSIS